MKAGSIPVHVVAAVVVLLTGLGAALSSPSAGQDRHPALTLLDRQVEAWNRGDLEGFLEGYWRSPELSFFSNGSRHRGWTDVRRRYRRRYLTDGEPMGELAFEELEIVTPGQDAAVVRGRYVLRRAGEISTGLFTLLLRRFADQGWRIVHDHTST